MRKPNAAKFETAETLPLRPQEISPRDKLILSGLYLSKYDKAGLNNLGFKSFTEAFNVIGYALGEQPASIKNYRDEFDPLFSNSRKGWHKRPRRDHCMQLMERYGHLDSDRFTSLLKSFLVDDRLPQDDAARSLSDTPARGSSFAQRLATGLAAERYFESVYPDIPEFAGYKAENTTRLGCGYDYWLQPTTPDSGIAVEVKGMRNLKGSISLTAKERALADTMRDRFVLFVVRNFAKTPTHSIYPNPLFSSLQFERIESTVVHVSWTAKA